MKKLIILLFIFMTVPLFAQVSDDWGKYMTGDTIHVKVNAKPYYKYMNKNARVTYVELTDSRPCAMHGFSININPFAKRIGFRYDYLSKTVGYYASVMFHGDWYGSKIPNWIEYNKPYIPEDTYDIWYINGDAKLKCDDPAPEPEPCPECPECPPCEPVYITEYIPVHDTVWVHEEIHHYIPPDETEVFADNRMTTTIGLNLKPTRYLPIWVSCGISLHGYVYNYDFIIPLNNKIYKPITMEVGLSYSPIPTVLIGAHIDTFRGDAMLSIGALF